MFTSPICLCVRIAYACPFCAGMLATVTQADYNDDGDDLTGIDCNASMLPNTIGSKDFTPHPSLRPCTEQLLDEEGPAAGRT